MEIGFIDSYLLHKLGVTKDFKEEWGWERYQIDGKMFCAICYNNNEASLVTLKLSIEHGKEMRENYSDILPGYYMNKDHWNSIKVSGCIPKEVLIDLLDESYQLVFEKLSKRRQKEILEDIK